MEKFWLKKSMTEMTSEEWESLCDGCARCCLHKLEDVETEKVHYTAIVCRFLDQDACHCTQYERRSELVPDCVKLTPVGALDYAWLPNTCAYRLVAQGKDLDWWHPLVSGDQETVHEAGISVKGKCVSELYVHPDSVEDQIIHWVEQ
ncbi:MAG: YcgN family cysteine cluster protein [Pseudomonadales bacterium]|nr:YcgN family cysteine cluster protein [Pseudomonadales bacterium]MBO6565295.1 YcgN family cysteine cluster protein [Pseudomonadales bacterium]MBO6595687.1 YcgN family cysteine cluster protein [Pseudomonadales bacterium]MBO6657379.1 YcgN family cysteine cluster protein [Pseudomonadales bacterium]MBO6702187.1 YcgN family cysteine cluster protein [Pseudomonadales bacterium]